MRHSLALLAALSCALPLAAQSPQQSSAERGPWRQRAKQVTVYRDTYGVPHVHGTTDADVMFGMAYTRSEDRFQETEAAYIQSLGRQAELSGEDGVGWDVFFRAFEFERLGKEEYAAGARGAAACERVAAARRRRSQAGRGDRCDGDRAGRVGPVRPDRVGARLVVCLVPTGGRHDHVVSDGRAGGGPSGLDQ